MPKPARRLDNVLKVTIARLNGFTAQPLGPHEG